MEMNNVKPAARFFFFIRVLRYIFKH